ncbi:uncharacterized protein LOC109848305 isoform X2 [Asparagus officinalis]|uniref:uncharacterized protein LOC109848305 isoform X2 n=1 Tax=Asparagus officinalis TaxID=4686 RepID=UPI00098E1BA0|nr:uncharacterized protein LOC109848305 isoform X2 [Asparagus officinalis]
MNPSSPDLRLWKISIRAKSRLFDLRLNASNVFPNLGNGGERISFLLRLRRLLLVKVKSENRDLSRREVNQRSSFFRFVGKILRRKQRRMDPHNRSRARDRATETRHRHGGYFLDIVTKAAWRAWNIIISIGCLSLFSQVLLSRTSLLVRRNLILWLIISAFMLFFLYKLRREMLFRCMNCALEAAPILISILLFPCQALFQTFGDHKDPGVLGLYFSSTYFWGRKLIKLIVTTLLQRH